MTEVLDKLKAGVRRFQTEVFEPHADAYRKAANEPQRPHTLFVACADSRVDVETITSSGPGELFTLRNVGNIVPSYGEILGGVSAAIEYAVTALQVRHVVICGHSDCGAMKATLNPEAVARMPTVKGWLNYATAALRVIETASHQSDGDRLRALTRQNVLMQMAHLRTHPSVAGALASGQLTISGWVYEIATGRVQICEDGSGTFVTVGDTGPTL